jgi:hypothetical protein
VAGWATAALDEYPMSGIEIIAADANKEKPYLLISSTPILNHVKAD